MNTNRALALAAILAATPALAHDVLDIARSSTGQLRVHHHIPMPMMLPASFIVGFDGWANVEPGFQTLAEDDPARREGERKIAELEELAEATYRRS